MGTGEQFRSFTHPVMNSSQLRGTGVHTRLAALMQSTMPKIMWPSLVHELTHHWCFNTAVSEALTLLYLKPILRLADRRAIDRYQMGADLLTYELAMGLLFPIIEGMALFTEFDVVPAHITDVYSAPLEWTALLHAHPERPGDAQARAACAKAEERPPPRFLFDGGFSRQLGRRKGEVLGQPVCAAGEGYLGG